MPAKKKWDDWAEHKVRIMLAIIETTTVTLCFLSIINYWACPAKLVNKRQKHENRKTEEGARGAWFLTKWRLWRNAYFDLKIGLVTSRLWCGVYKHKVAKKQHFKYLNNPESIGEGLRLKHRMWASSVAHVDGL